MKSILSILLLAWEIPRIQADSITDSIEVYYRHQVALGEQASLTITAPQNVFYQVFEIFYAPNGTSEMSSEQGNVPLNLTNGNDLHPHTLWTCTTRDDWGPGQVPQTKEVQSPDSTGDGWGYQVVLKLFYPNIDDGYLYGKYASGAGNVCITTPYTTQELRTDRHNFTVEPLANGATTTSLPSPTSGAAEGSLDGQYSLFNSEQWSFTDQPTGQTFQETPVPSSGANRIFMIYWATVMTVLFLVFVSLM